MEADQGYFACPAAITDKELKVMASKRQAAMVLAKEKEKELLDEIRKFFLDQRDEEIGELSARLVLDFIIETAGPFFYNRGVQDAYRLMAGKVEDLLELEKRER